MKHDPYVKYKKEGDPKWRYGMLNRPSGVLHPNLVFITDAIRFTGDLVPWDTTSIEVISDAEYGEYVRNRLACN